MLRPITAGHEGEHGALLAQKRIGFFFSANSGFRTMARIDDGFIRQDEQFIAYGIKQLSRRGRRQIGSAYTVIKQHIAGKEMAWHMVRNAARRVAGGGESRHQKLAQRKNLSVMNKKIDFKRLWSRQPEHGRLRRCAFQQRDLFVADPYCRTGLLLDEQAFFWIARYDDGAVLAAG